MSLFNGLKFGRPAYPLYLADAFKPVEPTALGLLAQVSMMKGKAATKDADGTTKEEKVEALGGETSNWYDMQAETKALDDLNKAMFAKVFKNHSNDYQDTPEFKEVIYPNMMKVESNKQLLKKNAVIGKTHLEEYNKANADLVAKFSEDEFAYDKNFKLIMGDDGKPLTRGKYNQLVYQNKNVNKEGLFIDPDFQYGVEYKSAITRIAKDINDAKETETREGLIGPQGTIVPGTYATGKSGSTSNVRKLNEISWAGSFKSTMSRPELEDAHLMYDHAILEGDGNAYKTEIIDDPDRKGKKKEVYSKDKDGNPIPIDFDGYMERVVDKVKTGKDIIGSSISMDYSGIPGWEDQQKAEKGAKYWSLFLAGRRATVDPVTGKRYLGLQYDIGIMDFGEVVGTVKDYVISDIFGESGLLHIKSLKHQYETITPTDKRSKEDLNSFIMKNMGAENMSKYYKYINNPNNKINKESKWGKGSLLHNADLTLEKWFGINQSSGEYDPKLLLTENEMKNYDIMITNTPTDQNRGYKTENTIITGNMVFRGDGGIEYSFSQEPGSTDSPMPVFSKITNGLVINNGQDTKNIAVGNIVIADKAQLKNVKFIYYDATTGKRVEGNAYDDDDKIYRKKSTAELELGSADAAKAAGMKPDQTVYVVYSGIDASFVIPNVLQENAGDDYTHVILPAERASQVQQSKILEQYYNNGK